MNAQRGRFQRGEQNFARSPAIAQVGNVGEFLARGSEIAQQDSEISIADISVRHLRSDSEISEIQFLRDEINLSLHRERDPQFVEHEKKEMN